MTKYNNRCKINLKLIIYILLLFPFIRMRTMEDYPVIVKNIYNCSAIISSCFMIFFIIIKKEKKMFKDIFIIFILMITYIILTLILAPSQLKTCYNCIFMLSVSLFLNNRLKKDTFNIIKALTYIYVFLTVLNNILVFLFPNGIYQTDSYHTGHLLGDDNAIIYIVLPAMILLSIYSYLKNKKITKTTIITILFCELVFIKLWAASAIIAFGLFMCLLFLMKKIKILSPNRMLLYSVVFCIIIFLFTNLPIITNFVVNVLHKSITFSGRTKLWNNGFNLILKSPIYGYGGYYVFGRSILMNKLYPVHTTHLQILIDGGLILFTEYILLYIFSFNKLNKNKDSVISKIITSGLVAMIVSYTFEQAGLNHLIIIATLALNIDYIIAILNEVKRND